MKFFTNKISTGSSGTFQELVNKYAAAEEAKQIKTASAVSKVKVSQKTEAANDDEEVRKNVHGVEGSPNDQNGEPESDGEKKTVKPAGFGGKSAKVEPSSKEEKISMEEIEADCGCCDKCPSCGCKGCNKTTKKVAMEEIEIEADCGKCTDGGGDGDSQDGVSKGKFPDEFKPEQKCEDDDKANVESNVKEEVRMAIKAAKAGNIAKLANMSPEGRKTFKFAFEKVSNLKPKQKNWLKNYYKMIWPEEFSDALVQDK